MKVAKMVLWFFVPRNPRKWAQRAVGTRKRYALMCGVCVTFGLIIMWGTRVLMNVAVQRNELQVEYGNHGLLAEVEWGLYSVLCLCIFGGVIQLPILCLSTLRAVLHNSDELSTNAE